MPYLRHATSSHTAAPSDGPRFNGYRRRRSDGVTADRMSALVISALASAALAVTITAGTALVAKLDQTVQGVEKERFERIASFGELSRIIGIVETKVEELIIQSNQLEVRLERNFSRDLDMRDRKFQDLQNKIEQLSEYSEQRRHRQSRRVQDR
jgi:hypothetical protein